MSSFSVLVCLVIHLTNCFTVVDNAHVVFFSLVSSFSHQSLMFPIADKLAENGHNVTYISTYSLKDKNSKVQEYVPKTFVGWMAQFTDSTDIFSERKNGNLMPAQIYIPLFGTQMCKDLYKDTEFLDWVKFVKVDLVILDSFANDCAYGIIHYFWDKAKLILFHTFPEMPYFSESYGLPVEPWLPHLDLPGQPGPEMSLLQRIQNTLLPITFDYIRRYQYFPVLEAITKQHLGVNDQLSFEELEKNTSMIFLNSHYSLEFPRSLPPHTIAVGGIALSGKKSHIPLSQELETFLSKGDEFIYVSFGSWTDITKMDESVKQAFIGTMNHYEKLKFVFKVQNKSAINDLIPHKNVYITDWVPQQKLLAHPKIKLFITQTGLISVQEAVYFGVPLICFPFHSEQDYNAEIIHRRKIGIKMEITSVTQAQLENAIGLILNDSEYRVNMQTVSTLFKERPQEPLETAVWWTEFVLRHSHEELAPLRPLGTHQQWWRKRGVDILIVIIAALSILLISFVIFIFKLMKFILWKTKKVKSITKKKLK